MSFCVKSVKSEPGIGDSEKSVFEQYTLWKLFCNYPLLVCNFQIQTFASLFYTFLLLHVWVIQAWDKIMLHIFIPRFSERTF
jgi:hypothetical protein